MEDDNRDLSFLTLSSIDSKDILIKNTDFESSLESYSNLFDKVEHNFTASSEISCVHLNNEESNKDSISNIKHNRTFTKEISKTMINAFTGKPISPNPWRKLCTKNVQQRLEVVDFSPIEIFSNDVEINVAKEDKLISREQLNNRIEEHQAYRHTINNQQVLDKSNDLYNHSDNDNDDDDSAFEKLLHEHRIPSALEVQQATVVRRRRKKRNDLPSLVNESSSSSNENIKEYSSEFYTKTNSLIPNDSSWRKLADVYTSEESDENNHLLSVNTNLTVRLKSEIFTSDQSSESSSSSSINTDERLSVEKNNQIISFNFLQSLSDYILFEDKHPDAKPYFFRSAFKQKRKRQELADKLLLMFNQDVFSTQLSGKISVLWSGRLTATAGHCTTRRTTGTAVITLSHKVCDSPERCRDTLLHEMCHAAVTLIDGVMEQGHGPLWHQWTRIAEQCYPYLPAISIKHTYDVIYKFTYRCVQCQHEVYRHSKSLNLDLDACGKCMGHFQLITNHKQNETNLDQKTPKRTINNYNLYVQENFQKLKQVNPRLSTPQLMKQLSVEYKKRHQQQLIDLPELDLLKI